MDSGNTAVGFGGRRMYGKSEELLWTVTRSGQAKECVLLPMHARSQYA